MGDGGGVWVADIIKLRVATWQHSFALGTISSSSVINRASGCRQVAMNKGFVTIVALPFSGPRGARNIKLPSLVRVRGCPAGSPCGLLFAPVGCLLVPGLCQLAPVMACLAAKNERIRRRRVQPQKRKLPERERERRCRLRGLVMLSQSPAGRQTSRQITARTKRWAPAGLVAGGLQGAHSGSGGC